MDAWVVEVLRVGYRIPFDRRPPLSERPLSLPAYSTQSIKGVALTQELQNLLRKGAVEPAPQSPGFYSRLFLVQKASGSWRPIIDLSTLNDYVTSSHFHMETPQSVLCSIRPGNWMVSLGPAGRLPAGSCSSRFASLSSLRGRGKDVPVQGPLFRSHNRAPSLHENYGSRFRHPPQVWGQDASLPGRLAHPGLFEARLFTVEGQAPDSMHRTWHPGQPHEIVSSSHSVTSVSRHGDSVSAFYSSTYSSTGQQPPASDRGVSIDPVSSSVPLASTSGPLVVPHSSRLWRDAQNEVAPALPQRPVGFPGRPVSGLLVPSLSRGSSLVGSSGTAVGGSESLSPRSRRQLLLRHLGRRLGGPSGRTPCLGPLVSSSDDSLHQPERVASSSVRPAGLRTSFSGPVGSAVLQQHHHSRLSSSFRRDVLLHSERHGEGDTPLGRESPCPSPASIHHGLVQCHSRRSESPQSGDRVRMDPSSGGGRSSGPQMAGGDRSVCNLLTARLPVYFSPASDSQAAGTDALLQPWDNLQAYAFPPIAIIRRVLVKLRSSRNCELTLITPFWPQREWFPDLLELLSDVPITLSGRRDLLRQPHFHRFHQNLPMLQLTAWRLSSDSPVRPASLLRWLDNLSSVEDSPHS